MFLTAQKYKQSGAKEKAVVAFEKASFAQEKLGSYALAPFAS